MTTTTRARTRARARTSREARGVAFVPRHLHVVASRMNPRTVVQCIVLDIASSAPSSLTKRRIPSAPLISGAVLDLTGVAIENAVGEPASLVVAAMVAAAASG
jgi:hypothetical protein